MLMATVERRTRRRWFPDLKAEALSRWVAASSDERLQSVMQSRLRRVLLWQIFRTMRQRAQPDERLNAVVEFRVTGRRDGGTDSCRLALANGQCRTSRRDGTTPALTLELDPVAFLRLVGGTASPQRLLLARKLKLRGQLTLALALPTALRLPKRRPKPPPRKR